MATPLTLTTNRNDGGVVLTAVGEIDLSNVEAFENALTSAAGNDGVMVSVDLAAVEYLDSGAINVLFGHADAIELIVNPILLAVLKVSGLADVVNIRPAPAG